MSLRKIYRKKYILLLACLVPILAVGEDSTNSGRQTLLGDWGGARSYLEEHGITSDAIITYDIIGNTSGGIRRDIGNLANFDLTFSLDTEKASLWENGTFFVYFLGNAGSDPSTFVGDAQVTDNIEAYDTAKLYEMWYDHAFADGSVSLLFGLHDYNSEFNALDYAGTLINSSFGIEPDISQVGPSIFSTTALALRARIVPTSQSYVLGAIYDGVPGDPNDPRGTHIKLDHDDGLFSAGELGYASAERDPHYKYAVGGWLHTAEFEDFSGTGRSSNGGLYFIGEHTFLTEEDPAQGLGAFIQSGFTRPDRNQFGNYIGTGLTYTGLFRSRDADIFSFGMAYARNGADYRRFTADSDLAETTFEITYHYELVDYLSLQPDAQYVRHPGGSSEIDRAVVIGLRAELAL